MLGNFRYSLQNRADLGCIRSICEELGYSRAFKQKASCSRWARHDTTYLDTSGFVGVCRGLSGFVGICRGLSGFVGICRGVSGFEIIGQTDIIRHTLTYLDTSGFVGVCRDMSGFFGVCRGLSGCVGVCRGLSGFVEPGGYMRPNRGTSGVPSIHIRQTRCVPKCFQL